MPFKVSAPTFILWRRFLGLPEKLDVPTPIISVIPKSLASPVVTVGSSVVMTKDMLLVSLERAA